MKKRTRWKHLVLTTLDAMLYALSLAAVFYVAEKLAPGFAHASPADAFGISLAAYLIGFINGSRY